MRCKLITQWLEDGREQTVEHTLDQDRITIGRGVGNTCVLKDPTRVVSTTHAEICGKQGTWSICDVGSTNGTMLNGARIAPKQEHLLHDGDRIAVGRYQLVFQSVTVAATSEVERDAGPQVAPISEGSTTESDRLRYVLQRAYGDGDPSSDAEVESRLDGVLRRALEGYDGGRARAAVQSVRAALGRSAGYVVDVQRPTPASKVEVAPEKPRRQNRNNGLLGDDVAKRVCEELAVSGYSLNSDQMATQLAAVLQAVCVGLADAVRGRREFQKAFEVEATRILAWKPNPIKHAESAEEIARILLTPSADGLSGEHAMASLKEVFQDLTVHQLGLMAGFRESIKGLLETLNPDVLEPTVEGQSKGKGIKLLGGGRLRSEAAAWRRYREKHRQLVEEEVKVFEGILAPHFAKGYLSVHKARKPT